LEKKTKIAISQQRIEDIEEEGLTDFGVVFRNLERLFGS